MSANRNRLIQRIAKHQSKIKANLFLANCLLLGKDDPSELARIANLLTNKTWNEEGELQTVVLQALKSGLENQREDFESILKNFIQHKAMSEFLPYTKVVILILETLKKCNSLEYRGKKYQQLHDFVNFQVKELDTSDKKNYEKFLRYYLRPNLKIESIPKDLQKLCNSEWDKIYLWAKGKDEEHIQSAIKLKQSTIKNTFKNVVPPLVAFISGLIVILIIMNKSTYATGLSSADTFAIGCGIFGMAIGCVLGAYTPLMTAVGSLSTQLDTHNTNVQETSNTLSNALENSFNIKLIEYCDNAYENKSKHEAPTDIEIKLSSTHEVSQEYSPTEKKLKKRKIRREIVFYDEPNDKSSTHSKDEKKTQNNSDEYENTNGKIIRHIQKNKQKVKLIIDKKLLKDIPDTTMRRAFRNKFKFGIFGKHIKLIGQEQAEITSGYNDRIFGEQRLENGEIVCEFKKRGRGLH